jgi:dephospho-CoA kinase
MNLGIIGKLGSGKTSAAEYIISKYGYTRMSLATPVKFIADEYFGVKSKADPRARKLWQKIGTDWFRSEDPDVWVKYLKKSIEALKVDPVICDDGRFINEVDSMLSWGWKLIYLECSEEERERRCIKRDGIFDKALLNHPSETGVDEIVAKYCGGNYITVCGARYYESGVIAVNAENDMRTTFENLDKVMEQLRINPKHNLNLDIYIPQLFDKLKSK